MIKHVSNYRTRNQKIHCNKFSAWKKKHDYAFILKNQKSHLKNTKLIADSGYQGIQKITIMF
ncbi:hypothetical protein [Spiroplasma poulsonii]|uniref:hypothetical protein n=1 Tax=Spiroplasma poulsonii TaxID=2138 RepID=UPI001F4CE849|nr:hypothetical protein [Spiroplasma poulsonii]UNF62362.1 hypothetical protein MNU24_02545 [Spiroplasma poulsonii]